MSTTAARRNCKNDARINKPIRSKVIVLGSSGAGKTSFIRRFYHNTFQDERKSTKCADFYSTILPNPLLEENEEPLRNQRTKKRSGKKRETSETTEDGSTTTRASTTTGKSSRLKKHKKKKHKKKKNTTEPYVSERLYLNKIGTIDGHILNHKTATAVSSESKLDPSENILRNKHVALQMWDTAGKERLLTESAGLTSRLGDAFFRHANCAILIYDATSSRSFLQLIKWYSELLNRISRVQSEEGYSYEYDCNPSLDVNSNQDSISDGNGRGRLPSGSSFTTKHFKRRFPVLVVATKLDRLKAEQSKSGNIRTVPQRTVLGLASGFKGMDYHYEYTLFHGGRDYEEHQGQEEDRGDAHQSKTSVSGSEDNGVTNKNPSSKERQSLSYGLEGSYWAKDKAYMDYVRKAEDECFPDRKMVKRWCRRNGLQHIEVSALEDMGVDVAVKTAVTIALTEMIEQEKQKKQNELRRKMHGNTEMDGHNLSCAVRNGKNTSLDNEDKCKFCQFLLGHFLYV